MTRLLTIAALCAVIALALPTLAGAAPAAAKAAKPACAESVSDMPWTTNMCRAERPVARFGGTITVDIPWLAKTECCDVKLDVCESKCICGLFAATCRTTSFGCTVTCSCLRCPA